jgi:hypothetical protein
MPTFVVVAAALTAVVAACNDTSSDAGSSSPTVSEVVAAIDAPANSCETLSHPIRLRDVFDTEGQWFETTPSQLVELSTGEVDGSLQTRVVVEGLAEAAIRLGDSDAFARQPVLIRQDRFDAVETTAAVGGPLYVQVYFVDEGRSGAQALVWIDPDGGAHFLGGCAPKLWTEPFTSFAESIFWSDTEESLLRGLINDGPTRERLAEWQQQ